MKMVAAVDIRLVGDCDVIDGERATSRTVLLYKICTKLKLKFSIEEPLSFEDVT